MILYFIIYIQTMQFTQIGQLNKLISNSRPQKIGKGKPLDGENEKNQNIFNISGNKVGMSDSPANIEEIINDINSYAKSLMVAIQPQEQIEEVRPKSRTQYAIKKQHQPQFFQELTFKKQDKFNKKGDSAFINSNMFKKNFKKNNFKKSDKKVKVFYFGMPTFKLISYEKQSLVQDVIDRAIHAYLQDKQLDKAKIKNISKEAYILRVQDDDDSCKPDLDVEPMNPKQKISDQMFQTFILMPNIAIKQSFDHIAQIKKIQKSNQEKNKIIRIFNENGVEIRMKSFQIQALTSEIYHFIESTEKKYIPNKFYLSQSQDSQIQIPRNIKIGQLQTQKLFIKFKIFADQPQYKTQTLEIQKQKSSDDQIYNEQIAPLSLSQASTYEQFNVIKINQRGNKQNRVLGIDQNKIYNFDKDLRKNGKQGNFIERIFGTKNIQRYIKDIISVQQQQKNKIIITVQEQTKAKRIIFEVQLQDKIKIVKKLTFLMNYIKLNNKN